MLHRDSIFGNMAPLESTYYKLVREEMKACKCPLNLECNSIKARVTTVIHLWDYLLDYHLQSKYLLKEMVCLSNIHAS